MRLTLRDADGERTIEAEWAGPVPADDLWIPHDEDFRGPSSATADVIRRRDVPWGSIAAVVLEIDGARGAGLVTSDGNSVWVKVAPDGYEYYDDDETEIAAMDALRPLPEIAASGKWITSTGESWVDAREYLASHPEIKDWYYAKSTAETADIGDVDDDV